MITSSASDDQWPFRPQINRVPQRPTNDSSHLPCVNYERSLQDPAAAPEKQAKIALDSAIASGSIEQLQVVTGQIGQLIPHQSSTLMMHAFRSVARQGNLCMMKFLLEQISSCQPHEVFDFMKYGIDGAATQDNPGMMGFLLGKVQEAFRASYTQQFHELVQHAFNAAAVQGNLALLKFLMDHAATTTMPVNYDDVFRHAVTGGTAETLLKDAIQGGAQYENAILMLLQSVRNLPDNNDSRVGSRQSLKNTAKLQVIKSYKHKDPALFARLMAAIKSYFPEELAQVQSGAEGDMLM